MLIKAKLCFPIHRSQKEGNNPGTYFLIKESIFPTNMMCNAYAYIICCLLFSFRKEFTYNIRINIMFPKIASLPFHSFLPYFFVCMILSRITSNLLLLLFFSSVIIQPEIFIFSESLIKWITAAEKVEISLLASLACC